MTQFSDLPTNAFFINGAWVPPTGAERIAVINPATEGEIATIPAGTPADVDKAVAAAKSALREFGRTTKADRLALLQSIRDVYERRRDDIAAAITAEMGAPISLSKGAQTAVGIGHLDGFVKALEAFAFETTTDAGDLLLKEPIGVVGLITPWNWPINQIALKILAALAAGCTMVLKPSEITPLNAILYMQVLHEAGVPPGVVNLVHGTGPDVGAALSRHSDVAMMSFTGSTRAGREITRDAALTIKRVTLELGGKSPNILLPDVDLEKAVRRGVRHVMLNSGQNCNAPTRMLVQRDQYAAACEIAADVAASVEVGDPLEPGRHLGPLASQTQWDRVQGLLETGVADGATLISGGLGRPDGKILGAFVKPTVFSDVSNDMSIAQEEIFGPVLCMIPYNTDDDAVAIANDTPYGLAAQVQSGDPDRAMAVARQIQAGMVHINGSDIGWGSPFGGYKMSGNGREGGALGIKEFLEAKAVSRP